MIRLATIEDLDIINEMLKSFDTKIDLETFKNHPFKKYLLNIQRDEVVAFLSFSNLYENLEIEYIYTKEDKRNRGFAHELVSYLIGYGISNNCSNISLEVRVSNRKAIDLYEAFGFTKETVRSNYYTDEDALLMVKKLGD